MGKDANPEQQHWWKDVMAPLGILFFFIIIAQGMENRKLKAKIANPRTTEIEASLMMNA